MDLVIIAIVGGAALLLVVALAAGVFLFLRRRSSDSEPHEAAEQPKKAEQKKKPAKPPAQQQSPPSSQPNSKSAAPQPAAPAPAASPPTPPPAPESGDAEAGEKVRILVVDDNPGTRDNVSRLLYFEDDMEVIGQAINGREGIEMAAELKPHIVLMDINMPDMDGITATKEMGTKVPFTQVVIMSVQSDQHYMKQAMAAGARDFQPKPFTSDELVSCLRRVYNIGLPTYRHYEAMEQAQSQPQAAKSGQQEEQKAADSPVIAVYSPKGGVGVSAVATNLAVALHREVGDVALMDAEFQFGDVMVHLNTRPTRTVSDMIHENQLEVELLPDVMLPHESGVKLLLAPPQPQLADFITNEMITKIIIELKKQFNAVVIDTGTQLSDRTLSVLDVADYILVVAVPELPSIKSVKLFLEVAEQLNFAPNRMLVALNRANVPGAIKPGQIKAVLKLPEIYQIPHDPKMHLALNRGAPVCQHEPGAPSARAITSMAQQLWQKISAGESVELEVA